MTGSPQLLGAFKRENQVVDAFALPFGPRVVAFYLNSKLVRRLAKDCCCAHRKSLLSYLVVLRIVGFVSFTQGLLHL